MADNPQSGAPAADSCFRKWEGMRIPFNLLLLAAVVAYLGISPPLQAAAPGIYWTAFTGWIVVNACYFAGPTIDWLACRAGLGGFWLTAILFSTGSLIACFLLLVRLFLYNLGQVSAGP